MAKENMFCKSCGAKLPEDAIFCMKCGVRLRGTAQDERILFESTMQQKGWKDDREIWENVTLIITNTKIRVQEGGDTTDTPLARIEQVRVEQSKKGGWFTASVPHMLIIVGIGFFTSDDYNKLQRIAKLISSHLPH